MARQETRTRPWRYSESGQLLPPLPPQPRKPRPPVKPLKTKSAAAELNRRSSQSRIAELDSREASQTLTLLKAAAEQPQPADLILPLVDWLATQRPGLRRRFVELTEYEAKHEQNERLKRLMKKTAELVEAGRPNRKKAA